jgi:hypothetical protein
VNVCVGESLSYRIDSTVIVENLVRNLLCNLGEDENKGDSCVLQRKETDIIYM